MDWDEIERLRIEGFTPARRGYDRREVDKFLGALVDWLETDAGTDLGGAAVKRKLELAGQSTAQILLTAENEAEQMRRQTEQECADLRAEAEAASDDARRAADDYSKVVRQKADEDARQTTEAARAEAATVVEEGKQLRAEIEVRIADLETRRDVVLQELERLQGELASTVREHKSTTDPSRREDGESGAPDQPAETEDKRQVDVPSSRAASTSS
jgi:DivIVA domain-containing protein